MEDAECLESRPVFRGRIVDLSVDRVRLPNREVADLEMIHHRGGAAVLPVLPDGRVILLSQFRYPTGGWLLEIPAGKLEDGEEPARCAERELLEETGFRLAPGPDGAPGELVPLGWVWTSPGFTDEKIWLFLARHLEDAGEATPESHEVFSSHHLDFEETLEKARSGELHDAKTVCALLRAAAHLRG